MYLNCGWGPAGYAALPASAALFAEMLARSTVDDLIAPFSWDRFETGSLLRPAMIPAALSVVGATCF
jgi:glycine/D-amino acid oxidase-like deaminating enzyme